MNFLRTSYLYILLPLCLSPLSFSQLTVQTGQTPTQLVQNVLVGNGTNAFNVTSQGLPTQFAQFNGASSNLGLANGIVLSTALLNNPLALNGPASNAPAFAANTGGHPLLNAIVSPYLTYDAALITFSFIPTGDTLQFDYVFASEEYHSYVNSSFNDVFGFFLTGPNPFGPNYNNTNIALIPGTNNPVTINSVNNGQTSNACTPGSNPSNPLYFVDNCQGTTVCFNGFTVPLTAIAPVYPCSTYTITLAVANTSDHSLHSAVFLEANSFQSNQVLLSANNNTVNGAVDTALYEGCGTVDLVIVRTGDISQDYWAQFSIGGTATNGVDYAQLPDSIYFGPNVDTVVITIAPIWDMISEGTETITITVTNTTCFNNTTSTITFLIYNTDPLVINAGNDTVLNCNGGVLTANVTGGVPDFNIQWSNGVGYSGPNTTLINYVNPTQDTWYYATVTDVCGNTDVDSVWVDYLEPVTAGFSMTGPDGSPLEGCGSASIEIWRTNFINQAKTYPIQVMGNATNGTDYNTIANTVTFNPGDSVVMITIVPVYDMVPEGSEHVIIEVVDTLCNGSTVPFARMITIRDLDPITVDAGDDIIMNCPKGPVNIVPVYSGGWPPYTYTWSNSASSPDISNVYPSATTIYTVTVTDSCGYSASDDVEVFIPDEPVADFTFPEGPYCEPQSLLFNDLSSAGSGTIIDWDWRVVENGTQASGPSPVIVFPVAGTFNVNLVVTNNYNCSDSVTKSLIVYPEPSAIAYITPQNPTTLYPEVTFTDQSTGSPVLWYWETGDGNSSTSTSFMHSYTESGEYNGMLVVTTEYGCTDTLSFKIIVKDETSVFIPNTFSPNGDGLNDFWGPIGRNWEHMELRVFDRWGEEVFYSGKKDYHWNGKKYNSGDMLKQDTYTYRIDIVDTYGKEYTYLGHVNLLPGR